MIGNHKLLVKVVSYHFKVIFLMVIHLPDARSKDGLLASLHNTYKILPLSMEGNSGLCLVGQEKAFNPKANPIVLDGQLHKGAYYYHMLPW